MLKLAIATLVSATALSAVPAPAHAQYYHHQSAMVTCASHRGQTNSCRLPYRGTARLVHQLSDRPCIRGRTWGQNGGSRVWVSRGCRADFAVRGDRHGGYDQGGYGQTGYDHGGYDHGGYDRGGSDRGGYDHGGVNPPGYDPRVGSTEFIRDRNYSVNCQANGSRTTCAWDTRYGNPYLMNTMSGTCQEGRDWGYTSDGRIWVDADCNARFGYHGNNY